MQDENEQAARSRTGRGTTRLHFTLSVPVRCDQEEVFALLADIQRGASPAAGVRMIKLPSGPTRVGTRWLEHVRMAPGWWMRVDSVVTGMTPPGRLEVAFRSRWFTGELTYEVSPAPGGCVLHQTETLRPRRLLRGTARSVAATLAPRLRRRLGDIRDLLERAPTPAPGPVTAEAA